MPTIEELWLSLRTASRESSQRRVDADHPHDVYLDFEPPNRPGLVAVCTTRPPQIRPLRTIVIDEGQRDDGRWFLRISLDRPDLYPVFAALCRDVIDFTRAGVSPSSLGSAVAGRLDHWRRLLERDIRALGIAQLRGLIGELCVLERLLDDHGASVAAASWTGPHGTPQDFMLPDGSRIEVKAARPDARSVQINGLAQLAADPDAIVLVVVRLDETAPGAENAFTAPMLVARILRQLDPDPAAAEMFGASLALAGWNDHPDHDALVVRLVSVERHPVVSGFPRLTRDTVPGGIQDADYTILLPLLDEAAAATGKKQ